jgi:Secretory lipase
MRVFVGLSRGVAIAAVLVVAAVAIQVPAAGAAAVPLPTSDPFYAVPAGIAGLANGTVLASRPITAYGGPVPLPAHAWEVKFKTLDNQGQPTATVATVLVPDRRWSGKGPRPLVSYQTAEDGVGAKCSPSYALHAGLGPGDSNSEAETSLIAAALLQGWAVVAPDYEGPASDFAGAMIEAHGVLDGIRAALRFAPAGFGAGTPIALWGYSGGALASSLAAQLQPLYAPELKLTAVALGGEVADVYATFKAFNGTAFGGGIVVGYVGLDRSYPSANLEQYLNPAGRSVLAANQTECLADTAAKYPFFNIARYEAVPNAIGLPAVQSLLRSVSPLWFGGTPTAPVYDYHAVFDELAPIGPDRALMHRYCAAGVSVYHVEDLLGEHISEAVTGALGAIAYLTHRFAGRPAPNNCRSIQ